MTEGSDQREVYPLGRSPSALPPRPGGRPALSDSSLKLGLDHRRLGRSFFERYTPTVARGLLGCILVRVLGRSTVSGRIVEAEAYRGADDPASHAHRGPTKRNAPMFGEAGHAYVYFSYGFHNCLNVTTEAYGVPGAVLIRALEPLTGLPEMTRRRGGCEAASLTNGPGKLTQALGIGLDLNGEDMATSGRVCLIEGTEPESVGISSRVGISHGRWLQWRYFVKGSKFVSKARLPPPRENA